MKLLFAHGWGFDASFWSPLAELLADWPAQIDDRGYFGKPAAPIFDGEPCLAVTHSLGTMRVLAEPPPGLAGIVAINGFACFTGDAGVPRRVVDRMTRRFQADPAGVLREFRRTCGCDAPFGAIDAPLGADLLRLREETAPPPRVPVLSLQGARDPILPAAMRAAVFAGCAVRRLEHPGGGHLLPLEEPGWCARAVREAAATLA